MAKAQRRWQAIPQNRKVARERNASCTAKRKKYLQETNPAKYLWLRAKGNAAAKGVPFTLHEQDLIVPDVCPVLGIPLFFTPNQATPNTPSVDRIEAGGPYSKDNVIVISLRANTIKNCGTPEEHQQIYEFFSHLQKTESPNFETAKYAHSKKGAKIKHDKNQTHSERSILE